MDWLDALSVSTHHPHKRRTCGSDILMTSQESTRLSHASSYAASCLSTSPRAASTSDAASTPTGLKPNIHPSKNTSSSGPDTDGQVEGSARSPRPAKADLSYLRNKANAQYTQSARATPDNLKERGTRAVHTQHAHGTHAVGGWLVEPFLWPWAYCQGRNVPNVHSSSVSDTRINAMSAAAAAAPLLHTAILATNPLMPPPPQNTDPPTSPAPT